MIDTIIFDLGGVLIRWEPRHIYKDYFETEEDLDYFFDHICSLDWNERQDGGRPVKEATESLVRQYPDYEEPIRMYYDQWTEMIRGPVDGTVEILVELKSRNTHRLLALTNWSGELFPYARENFPFLNHFEGILVSGEEKMVKPDPKIYQLLMSRYNVDAPKSLFIDDNKRNIIAAEKEGMKTVHFQDPEQLYVHLKQHGVL